MIVSHSGLPPTAVWSWPRIAFEAARLAPHVWLPANVGEVGGSSHHGDVKVGRKPTLVRWQWISGVSSGDCGLMENASVIEVMDVSVFLGPVMISLPVITTKGFKVIVHLLSTYSLEWYPSSGIWWFYWSHLGPSIGSYYVVSVT